jgi:hypothetical protein
VARYFFHLADLYDAIPDEDGVEISNLEDAHTEALTQIEELWRSDPSSAIDWAGWRLHIADAAGVVVCSINLDQPFR